MRRRFALFAIGIVGIIQTPDRGTTAAAALIREAENLAYFEGFEPAKAMLEQAVRTASGLGDLRTTAIALDRLGSVLHLRVIPPPARSDIARHSPSRKDSTTV